MKMLHYLLVLFPLFSFAQKPDFTSYRQELPNFATGIDFIAVPEGTFRMGSVVTEVNRKEDEGPTRQVKVNAFWMGKFEVPWELYELFVFESADVTLSKDGDKVDALTRPTPPYLDMTFGMGKEGFPAVGMTQYNAIQFCKWLYLRTGVFYRLPTEAEWEYASRAGTESAYFFGESEVGLDEYAWYSKNSDDKTHPIGLKKENPWGFHDLYGNVAEWTYDQYLPNFYQEDAKGVVDNPIAEPIKLYPIVVRGGSFKEEATALRSASRGKSDPSWKVMDPQTPKSNWWFPEAPFVGIRLVRPLHQPSKEEIENYYNRAPIADY